MTTPTDQQPSSDLNRRSVLRRFGVVAVLFFLIKGMLWLAVPGVLLVKGCAPVSDSVDAPQP